MSTVSQSQFNRLAETVRAMAEELLSPEAMARVERKSHDRWMEIEATATNDSSSKPDSGLVERLKIRVDDILLRLHETAKAELHTGRALDAHLNETHDQIRDQIRGLTHADQEIRSRILRLDRILEDYGTMQGAESKRVGELKEQVATTQEVLDGLCTFLNVSEEDLGLGCEEADTPEEVAQKVMDDAFEKGMGAMQFRHVPEEERIQAPGGPFHLQATMPVIRRFIVRDLKLGTDTAEGVEFSDGHCIVRYRGDDLTLPYLSPRQMKRAHGHRSGEHVEYLD